MDKQIKAEPTTIETNSKCPYCHAKITAENELREKIRRIKINFICNIES